MDEFTAQYIGGDQPKQDRAGKKSDDPQPGKEEPSIEKIDSHLGHQWIEDTVQSIKDELQNKKSNPKGQDDQDSCKDLRSKMFKNFLDHAFRSWQLENFLQVLLPRRPLFPVKGEQVLPVYLSSP